MIGVASGGERSSRRPAGADLSRPGPRAARLGDAPARPYAASPTRARSCRKKPTLRRLGRLPLVCGRRRGIRTKGGVRGCATPEAAVAATAHDLNYEVALSHAVPYIIGAMDSGRYSIEIEPEVRLWLENIPAQHYKQAERVADLLAEQPTTLDEPHSRHLGGKLRELRFRLGDAHQRITYWLAPGRRVVLLTVFRKTKMREQAEVDRAHAAQRLCEAEHEAAAEHDLYSRDLKENR